MPTCKLIPSALLLASASLLAQNASTAPSPAIKAPEETLVVLGNAAPTPLAESARPVTLLPAHETQIFSISPLDLLRADASVFLEQRGAGGGQTDLVLRGGGIAQTLVLLNGFRINDSQTPHHTLDLPLPLEALDSIQVLAGAGSALHGTDALAGVVDFCTVAPSHASLRLRAAGGSFTSNEESLLAEASGKRASGRLTASRNFSEGFRPDRDYRNENASSESWFASRLGLTDLLIAASDRRFGADQFYGNYNSWEQTKSWFASLRQDVGARTSAAFAYRRHTDEFILLRTNPTYYANHHVDSGWQAALRHTLPLPSSSLLLAGLEADGDTIHSSNLGSHARNRGAGFLDLDLRPQQRRWTLSMGAREEIFSGGTTSFAPQMAASFRVVAPLRLHAAGGYGFRIPTYTDLYYSDPATTGNAGLKPESAWSGEGGADWKPSSRFSLAATGFYSRQHAAIDYVRTSSAEKWRAVNLRTMQFSGIESTLDWQAARAHHLRLSWAALHGAQEALDGLQSRYVFNYPVQNLHAAWSATLPHALSMTQNVQLVQRYQKTPYPVWNAALARHAGLVHPFLRLENLSNTGYEEVEGVIMPGRSVTAGFALQFGH